MFWAILAVAQVNPGAQPFTAYDSHEADTINLQNLNIILNVPIFNKSGAFPFTYGLQMDSYVHCTGTFSLCGGTAWSLGFTSLVGTTNGVLPGAFAFANTHTTNVPCPDGRTITDTYSKWVIKTPDGSGHALPATMTIDTKGCFGTSVTGQAIDGSGFSLTLTDPGLVPSIFQSSGLAISTNAIKDSNGNTISQSGAGANLTYTDTLGLTTITTAAASAGPTYSWTDVNGGTQQVSITNTTGVTLKSAFGCTNPTTSDYNITGQSLPTTISFPDGTALGIAYENTPGGSSGQYTGRVSQLTLRTLGNITYNYNPSSAANDGINCTYGVPNKLTRTTADGTTTYTWALVNNGGGNFGNTTTVLDNDGNATVYTFTGLTSSGNSLAFRQVLTEVQRYQGSVSPGNLLTTDVYCYNAASGQPGNCVTANVNQNFDISEVDVYHTINGMTTSSPMQTKYDAYGNVTYSAQYDFGASTPTTATTTTYGSCSAGCTGLSPTISPVGSNVNNKPGDVLTTQSGVTVAESRFTYDIHGNLLTTYTWNGSTWLSNTAPNSYNPNGTIATSYDLANNQTTYAYNGVGGCNSLFPTSVTAGGLTTSSTWNCTGGVKLTGADANGNTTTYCYNTGPNCNTGGTADPFWRVVQTIDPLGNIANTTYPTGSSPDTASSSFTFSAGRRYKM